MVLTDHCVCVVDSCWRKGICEFCINNHGGNKASVSCALSPQAYEARKRHWEQCHDEPQFPTNTALGILSKQAMLLSKEAILNLQKVQKDLNGCTLSPEMGSCPPGELIPRLKQIYEELTLIAEQTEAALHLATAVESVLPNL